MVNCTESDFVDEWVVLRAKCLENANTGSSSMMDRKWVSTASSRVPVRAKRSRSIADVPDS